jgi:type I restriction enzyme S subunit
LTKVGYRMTEIGEIPEEWSLDILENEVEIMDSRRVPLSEVEREQRKGPFPYCGANGIIDYVDDYIFDEEAILLAEDGGSYGKFQNSAYLMDGKYWVNNHAHIIKGKRGIVNNKYILYWLNYSDINKYISGSTRAKLNQERLKSIPIPRVPLPEQQKIAEILSTTDDEIQKVDEQITLTEQLKKGLMQRLLTRGIGHTRFKMTEIGEIPEEWDVKKIRELRQNIYYGITAKATKENTNLRMLRTTDIKNFKFDLNNLPFCQITEKRSDLSKYFLKRNDIIIARAGTVGVSILVEENLNNVLFGSYLIKIIFKQETIDMPFIHYYFQSQLYWNNISNAQGSTIKNINLPFLNSLEIPLPPIPEQQKIAEILSTVDNKLELLGTKRDKLNVLKKGLMNDLLTGKVRVKV